MTDPAKISAALYEPFPVEVIDEKNGLLYVPHEIVRDRVNAATGNCYDWSIDQIMFRDDGVTRRGIDRTTGEARRPMSMIVVGTLTIPGLGSRAGIGAHPLDEGSGEDAAYKSAESDAFKRAAMAFGVGLTQLYIETGEAKRSQKPANRQRQSQQRTKPPTHTQPDPARSDTRFGSEVRKAITARNGETLRQLVDEAGEHVGRWIELVNAADSDQALEWVEKQIERRGIGNDLLSHELAKRKSQLGVTNPATATPRVSSNADPGSMTDDQRTKVFGYGKGAGLDSDAVKAVAYERYNIDSMTKMSAIQADDLIAHFKAEKAKIDAAPLGQSAIAGMNDTIDRAARYLN